MAEKFDQEQEQAQQAGGVLLTVRELQGAGWSLRRIADYFESQGTPSPTRWKGKPARWTPRTVKRLLDKSLPAAPELPSVETPSQPLTFSGPITVVATGTLKFDGPVHVHGPEQAKTDDSLKAPSKGLVATLMTSPSCEASRD